MKNRFHATPDFPFCVWTALFLASSPLLAVTVTWDNSNSTGAWSTPANWDTNLEPLAADDVVFPTGLAGTITLSAGENAKSLQLDDAYTLAAGGLTLATASTITVANGITAIINTPSTLTGGSSKAGDGTLVLGTSNTNATGITINGGRLDFRNNTTATITTGALTVSGASGISVGNNGSGSSQIFDFPQLNVSGDTTLTVTPVTTTFIPNFQNIALAGNLTVNNTSTARIQTITEDGFPRTLIKTGGGTLELEGTGNHSGGTEVIAGTLLVKNATALGSAALTLGATSGIDTAIAAFSSGLVIPNNLVVRSGGSGVLTFDSPSGAVTWNGNLSLQKAVTFDNGSSTLLSTFNGVISGSGNITKISAGEIALTNAANTFTGAIAINDGTLSVTSDGALGNATNVTTLAGDAVLKIDGTFASSRTFSFTGTTNNLSVSGANEFTLNAPLAGAGTFLKSGTGIMTIAPGVDSSARSGATSGVTGGILRVQGVKNLSDTGIITLNGGSGTIEFLRDVNTTFPHPVTADGTGTLHVDRAIGGSGNNGRHTLGTLGMAAGNLTVTGANGYGLSFGPAIISSNSTIANNAPGALVLASLTGNPTTTRTLTFGGTVIEKGILAIAADSALGNSTAPLAINGGCLASSGSFILTRDVVIGANGGNLRSNEIPHGMEIAGSLEWSATTTTTTTTTIDGIGRTVISGSTTGPGGDLVIGSPMAFATGITTLNTWSSRVCLQGAAALPAGNLSITNNAVLELGNGNFTRPLGTGPGQVQLPTSYGAGWAAVGADRIVNIGGAGALLLWGQTSPAFLYNPSFGVGSLILGSTSGTHTVDLQNPLDFNNTVSSVSRLIITNDGTAAVDARISGDLGLPTSLSQVFLETISNGTLEISGDIIGPVSLAQSGAGRTILSGNNDLPGFLDIAQGTLELANNASLGEPEQIQISSGATLDAIAMTVPVSTSPGGSLSVDGNGVLDGDVLVTGSLSGTGEITGDVIVQPFSVITSSFDGTLHIGGNLTFEPASGISFAIFGTTPEANYNRLSVTGAVDLDGNLFIDAFSVTLPPGFSGTLPLILNDGTDLITDNFASYPEGATIPLLDGRSLQITYLANGDGGPVGNDFAVTVIGGGPGSDLSVTGTAPAAVSLGAGFTINYDIGSVGPALATGRILTITKPASTVFALPHPANSIVTGNAMTVTLPALVVPDSIPLAVNFTAPAVTSAVAIVAVTSSATTTDPVTANNTFTTTTAVLTGGAPVTNLIGVDPIDDTFSFGIDTIAGIKYVTQRSQDLVNWQNIGIPFISAGGTYVYEMNMLQPKEFYRFGIVPQGASGPWLSESHQVPHPADAMFPQVKTRGLSPAES